MGTQIWSANIIVGTGINQKVFEKVAIKKLPIHILMSNSDFIAYLKKKVAGSSKSDAAWKKLPKDKITDLPKVEIEYIKYLGDAGQEPQLTF